MPSIYDDPDVARTYSTAGPDATLLISQLGPADAELARTFFDGQAACFNSRFALADCLASLSNGVRAVDGFSSAVPVGWKKNIVFEMTKPLDQLFYEHGQESGAQAFAEWMEQTIFLNGWHVDSHDDLTALGNRRQECMNIWMKVGMRRDPQTGKYLGPSLEPARRLAAQQQPAGRSIDPGRPQLLDHPVLGPALREAKLALDRIKHALDTTGAFGTIYPPYLELPMTPLGVGIALTQGGSDLAVVSVNAGQPESVVVGMGLARGFEADRLRLLDWVNKSLRCGLAYAPCLWENENAWDVVTRRQTSVTIMTENPAYCIASILDGFNELEWLRGRWNESFGCEPPRHALTEADGIALMAQTIGG